MRALAALSCLQQAPDLIHFRSDRSGEPTTRKYIVKPAECAVTEVELFDMANLRPSLDFGDLEPGVETAGNAMLKDDVDAGRALPRVARDH